MQLTVAMPRRRLTLGPSDASTVAAAERSPVDFLK
jgi:hypothetical protein